MKRILVGITGASGVIIGVELLKKLKNISEVETHLIISDGAILTIRDETNFTVDEIKKIADVVYNVREIDSAVASGSFKIEGMAIVPCSMKTLAGIASGYCENLLLRAADVSIKENRKLILVPREMPFSKIHLRNMKELADMGVIIIPPVMTFYNLDISIHAQINHVVNKILQQLNLPTDIIEWNKKI